MGWSYYLGEYALDVLSVSVAWTKLLGSEQPIIISVLLPFACVCDSAFFSEGGDNASKKYLPTTK